MGKIPQSHIYALKITEVLQLLFDEESEYAIDKTELIEGENNLTDFFHALANVAPTNVYNKLVNDDKNQLEFNHIANQLCFQYSKKSDEDKE
ncbi:MAG: hypothetical protein KGV59_01585 [Tenacibaculum sp.]|nr:hypothetical protein [Tenacibaculum sp.]